MKLYLQFFWDYESCSGSGFAGKLCKSEEEKQETIDKAIAKEKASCDNKIALLKEIQEIGVDTFKKEEEYCIPKKYDLIIFRLGFGCSWSDKENVHIRRTEYTDILDFDKEIEKSITNLETEKTNAKPDFKFIEYEI